MSIINPSGKDIISVTTDFCGKPLTLEVNRVGFRTTASVLVTYGDTVVLGTAMVGSRPVVLDYFPLAIAEVAKCSKAGNDQHNPGQPLHWAKGKSTDHADCIPRHLIDRGTFDTDGIRHSAKLAWRALALLQIELENEQC